MKKRYLIIGLLLLGFALLSFNNILGAYSIFGKDISFWILIFAGALIILLNLIKVVRGILLVILGSIILLLGALFAFYPNAVGFLDPKIVLWVLAGLGFAFIILGIVARKAEKD